MENSIDSPKSNDTKKVRLEPYDFYLTLLITFAENGIANVPITLQVNGLLVSGVVISGSDYLKQFALGAVDNVIQDALKTGELKMPEPSEDEEKKEKIVKHIHLKDAKVFSGGSLPIPANESVLWRGRLSSIDGYWIGSLSVQV